MSVLSRRGPYANQPAKLPGIQAERIADPATREAIAALREWVEVRLGARGDKFERAVTERDFQTRLETLSAAVYARIDAVEATIPDEVSSSQTTPQAPATSPSVLLRLGDLETAVALLTLRMGAVEAALAAVPQPEDSLTLAPVGVAPVPGGSIGLYLPSAQATGGGLDLSPSL